MFILSFAISSYRKHLLPYIIRNIERQSVWPEKILIYYSQEPWHLDKGLERPPLIRSFLPIEFRRVPNIGSCRKYIYTLREYYGQDKLVMLIDDDVAWRPDVFKTLLDQLWADNLGVVTTRGWNSYSIIRNKEGEHILRNRAIRADEIEAKREILVPNSGWCTLLNSRYIDRNLFDRRLQAEFGLVYSDEVFLAAMTRARKYVVPIGGEYFRFLDTHVHQWLNKTTSSAKIRQLKLFTHGDFRSNSVLS